ncbi:MAG: leucine-rich repeat domain-containing protein, partial [Muribaculaceae bacterium]|nr:leucine-rich repeat domain-containing protein [Muribaculaceae bacterium]
MKKLLLFMLGVLMALPAFAQDFTYEYEGQTLNYTVLDEDAKTVMVSGTSVSGDLMIPAIVKNGDTEYSVNYIDSYAFCSCSSLTSVVIPNTVTSIGSLAFDACLGLTSIVIPESVTSIGDATFSNCIGLTSIDLPNSVNSIGWSTFVGCIGLTSIVIPESVTSISPWTFYGCSGLTSLIVPNSVKTIGENAFLDCISLKEVILGNSVETIDNDAFCECPLDRVAILNPDITIATSAFNRNIYWLFCPEEFDASSIPALHVIRFNPEGGITFLEDGTVLGDNGETLLKAPIAETLESYSIPDGVVTIKSDAFDFDLRDWGNATIPASWGSITIPASVAVVEADAFASINFERVNFVDWTKWYENVKFGNLESNPYRNCGAYAGGVKITAPELKEGMTEIRDYVNCGLEYKDEVELPSTLKRIGAYAFYNNTELYSVILPDGLEEIGESAFQGCGLLENQTFPASLKKIEDAAYRGCSSLTEVELPEGLNSLGNAVFAGCGI